MEDGVKGFETLWELEATGVSGDDVDDLEGSKSLVVEFLHRAFGFDVARVQPARVADVELGDRGPTVGCGGGVTLDGEGELFS